MRGRPPAPPRAEAPLLLVLVALAAAQTGCVEDDPVVVRRLSVTPGERVASCERLTVQFQASRPARFSLTHGGTVLALGVTEGRPESLELTAAALEADARDLRLTLVGADGSRAIAVSALRLAPENSAPIARPRLRGLVGAGATVTLDGTLSEDPEPGVLAFRWSLVGDSRGAALGSPGEALTTLTLPEAPASFHVELGVTDSAGAADTALVPVTDLAVADQRPVLGQPAPYEHRHAAPGEDVLIRVEATHPGGGPLEVSVDQLAGPEVELRVEPDQGGVRLRAPARPASVALGIEVSDGASSARSRVVVTVGDGPGDAPPSASVTAPETVPALRPVLLDASGSTDPDSEDLTFAWTLLAAPADSLLGVEVLRDLSGPGRSRAEITPDLPGEYVFGLEVADAVGPGLAMATVSVTAELRATPVHDEPVAAIACAGAGAIWSGPGRIGIARLGTAPRSVPGTSAAVAWDGRHVIAAGPGPSVLRLEPVGLAEVGSKALPEGPTVVHAIVVDPHPSRAGDLYVGTDQGTAILDVSDSSCLEGCWVGSRSTGYVHRPPSLAGHSSPEVNLLEVGVTADGVTVVHLANELWLARLERRGEAYEFLQAPIDLFDDGAPQATTALATSPRGLFAAAEGLGLVWREVDRDCGFAEGSPRRCLRPGGCWPAPSAGPPESIVALAAREARLYVASSDGLAELDVATSRFAPFRPTGLEGAGAPVALRACEGTLYLGTAAGLWAVVLEEDGS